MGKKIKYDYNEETGRSAIVIWTKGKRYRGTAITNELDKDVMNSYTGQTIALARAEIKRTEGKETECKRKIRQARALIVNQELEMIKINLIKVKQQVDLDDYIDAKAAFANQLRDVRLKKEGIRLSEEGQ